MALNDGEKLNDKTPKWFQEWHYKHFISVRARSKRNERLIYAVLATVLAANLLGHWHNEIASWTTMLIRHFCGVGG